MNIPDELRPEHYGYKIGQNIGPYVNNIIELAGTCYLSPGVHLLGRNDSNKSVGNIYSDSIITWGWGDRKGGVQLIGEKGWDQTSIKLVDRVHTKWIYGSVAPYVMMMQPKYDESCDNCVIRGITFDGNHQNNAESSTIDGIRLRGQNTLLDSCKFVNFGVGKDNAAEAFDVVLCPIDLATQGPTVQNCIFTQPGQKSGASPGFVCEHTLCATSGHGTKIINNTFRDCLFDPATQQSPMHGVTLSSASGALVAYNHFINFQGGAFYVDSFSNDGVQIVDNDGTDVWNFIQLTVKQWGDPNQISLHANYEIARNIVRLANGGAPYRWDLPAGNPTGFLGYCFDPSLDRKAYPGFRNVRAHDNKVTLGYWKNPLGALVESTKLVSYWGDPVGSDQINVDASNTFISTLPPAPVVVHDPAPPVSTTTAKLIGPKSRRQFLVAFDGSNHLTVAPAGSPQTKIIHSDD